MDERRSASGRLALAWASFFGTGRFPVAPATFATFVLYGIAAAAGFLRGRALEPHPAVMGGAILFVTLTGVWASRRGEEAWGHDAGRIVIDEIAGALITVWWLPLTPQVLLAGFFAFRVMDILKPPPAYQIQSLPGGWGVMADDLVAGAYAHGIVRATQLLGWV